MAAFFQEFIDLADDLIRENGEISTLTRRLVETEGDMPWRPEEVETEDTDVAAVYFDEVTSRKLALVKEGHSIALLSTLSPEFEPNASNCFLTRANGDRLEIVNVQPLNPNGEKILWTVEVRK
jgi:hypothetical protein